MELLTQFSKYTAARPSKKFPEHLLHMYSVQCRPVTKQFENTGSGSKHKLPLGNSRFCFTNSLQCFAISVVEKESQR